MISKWRRETPGTSMTKSELDEERPKVFVPWRSVCVRPSMLTLASMVRWRAGGLGAAGRTGGVGRGGGLERRGSGLRRAGAGRAPAFGDSPTLGLARETGS